MSLTADRLREVLKYDPKTGVFTWLVQASTRAPVGSVAGSILRNGYRRIGFEGSQYLAHRLAWFYVTGDWPTSQLDHANGDRGDNRWNNLRAASAHQNSANRLLPRTNTSGFKGVRWVPERQLWRAQIGVRGKYVFLGHFDDPAEAHRAYVRAAENHFGQFARAA